ncbi:C25 family cysteine peptidase [Ferruginibacter yonginensis]|uniref:C25 family cysteine peptidase n=1 Tax=Ferruginibacter yonginensis TaxID=1310416 RepID=A0ABV8QQZ2_9BACT
MKKCILPLLLLLAFTTKAQLNNSWIDYSKTYYKFKLGTDNICRIPQTTIANAGLSATNADHFQLWRNGKQVRLFTSVNGVALGASDYIEFFGEMNDGKADATLYKSPTFQLADRYSLETDTATYFLTVNTAGGNLRYITGLNNITGATNPDLFFMRTIDVFYRNQINYGFGKDLGEYVYSSAYDIGEGYTSSDISTGASFTETFNNLNVYTAGPANSVNVTAKLFSNTDNITRTVQVKLNNNIINSTTTTNTAEVIANVQNMPLTSLTSASTATVNVGTINQSNPAINDRLVIATLGLTYPATFNFNNTKSFAFDLAASASGNYLLIDNFNYGTTAPILYDITNGIRYVGDVTSTPGKVKFVLPASTLAVRKFILNNVEAANIITINSLQSRVFFNYNTAANRGDYIIITNPVLFNDGNGNNHVETLRAYRASANGGGYNAKIVDANELIDQFAFGIKNHPASIRDFVRFMDQQYPIKPKYIFIIGRGVAYNEARPQENNPILPKINLVPSFGWPASDILLVSQPGTVLPIVPIGRLAAINGSEVGTYVQKLLQYEQVQRTGSPLINDKEWMKNMIHIIGGKTQDESNLLSFYMNQWKDLAKDTLMGAHVETFIKSSSATTQQINSARITDLINGGVGFIGYFGHSSATTFEYNLADPAVYNNVGKYPFFEASGCTAGDFYTFDPQRLNGNLSISERYIFANQRGSIGFLADTHFGIPFALNNYNLQFYKNFSLLQYGQSVGNQLKAVIGISDGLNPNVDYYTRIHLEEINLHGDPAIKINNFDKPDYVIEDPSIVISPSIISIADASFNVKVKMQNLGRAVNDSMRVYVKRLRPNTTVPVTLIDTLIPAIKLIDSLNLNVPITPSTDVGNNSIIVELDYTNRIAELYETNNKITKNVLIFEDNIRPVYPYEYAIVNNQNITFAASTANPIAVSRNYIMEIDTTTTFNSPFKKVYNKTSIGGVIEFTPTNLTFSDSTVYYWRTGSAPTNGNNIVWNNSSFIFLPNSTPGFNQSHYYQNLKSTYDAINIASDRTLKFDTYTSTVKIKNGVFPTSGTQAEDYQVDIDGSTNIQSLCGVAKIIINAINPSDMEPKFNNVAGGPGQFGSEPVCAPGNGPGREYNFQYSTLDVLSRNKARDCLDSIPNGYYVIVRNVSGANYSLDTYAAQWQADGPNSLYTRLKDAGFNDLDSFNRPRAFNFIYRKANNSFVPMSMFSVDRFDRIILEAACPAIKGGGTITSPMFGPAKAWDYFHWRGKSQEIPTGDSIAFNIIGVTPSGTENVLLTVDSTLKDVNISSINANVYPYLKIKMINVDKKTATPYQVRYIRLNYTPVPEGAVAPNILFTMKDTVEVGEPINFSVAFKNISQVKFDSMMRISLKIRTNNNVDSIINLPRGKILIAGDTLKASYTIPTQNYLGNNTLIVEFNPNRDQPEQYLFNNILYKNFFVKNDPFNPILDVTFDGVHILSRDIVASKPNILIKLKDENRFLALKDTALLKVQLRYPDQTLRNFYFNNDTMRFIPANITTGENAASIEFKPFLPDDGEYELIVTGKDVSGNSAGALNYRTVFTVYNKPAISEMLNYPNPFTTSTAFVFTLTGSQVPQNLRIQILTITGKIVREVTKEELGPIHIGRNITEFKWDGTDMYGQKLANGVYIYRVITNLNGKSLDKYKADGDNTDKYFNKGYGKMYLMR